MKPLANKGKVQRVPVPLQTRNTRKNPSAAYLKHPHLSLMDRLLRSFNQVAPADWIPSQYHSLLNHPRKPIKNLH